MTIIQKTITGYPIPVETGIQNLDSDKLRYGKTKYKHKLKNNRC
jgi:hypothetical protein